MMRWHPVPAELSACADNTPATILLETASVGNSGSESLFFTAPLRIVQTETPAEIPALFAEIERAVAAGHSAAGFFPYECGAFFEPRAAQRPGYAGQPLAWFGIYERPYRFDHRTGVFLDGDPPVPKLPRPVADLEPDPRGDLEIDFGLNEQLHREGIVSIHEWIRGGEVYQLNFTAPLRLTAPAPHAPLYARLRARQPAEFCAFLHWRPGKKILSFSPELFFCAEEPGGTRRITTRPMKGTAARGRTTREDLRVENWLRNDEKNHSENVMIVDLLRNDLGRLCRFGTVKAEDLFAVERLDTLWQMTSTVVGELRPDVNFQQIFRALFPCGSVTGAPKVRAMQRIAEIEAEPRGVYTGAIGYFSPKRTVFSVAIRTITLDGESGTFGVGSGIVIDSVAAEEYRECRLKAEFLAPAANGFSLVETVLWSGGFPFLELHLERLEDSAAYFGFECDRSAVRSALCDRSAGFPKSAPRKVRVVLDREGGLGLEDELVSHGSGPGRICIARQRTDSRDRMYFHKTTHRPLYAEAWKAAKAAGYDDAVFLNERDEVTEGAISNLFVEKDGLLVTPPVECGLLPGVYRRHILETRTATTERVLSLRDLRAADAVYLTNAVRGLRRVTIDWEFE